MTGIHGLKNDQGKRSLAVNGFLGRKTRTDVPNNTRLSDFYLIPKVIVIENNE